jgi:putative effector of murein hydrolase
MTDPSPHVPLAWLAATLAAYGLTERLQRRTGLSICNPLLVTTPVMASAIAAAGIGHADYLHHVAILRHLLGTAIVALAVPLHLNLLRLRSSP